MPDTSASSPARLRSTIRREIEEKPWWTRKRRAARSHVSTGARRARHGEAGRGFLTSAFMIGRPAGDAGSALLEAVADTIERFDHLEVVVHRLELLAQALDVAVDGAVVDVDLVVVGRVHERVPALHHAWPRRQRLQDEELGHRQRHRVALPGAGVAFWVHAQIAALKRLRRIDLLRRSTTVLGRGAPQHRLDALDQEALRERLADEIVGAHFQAEQLVDLLVLGGEEDHRQVGLLAQAAEQLHAVHARHLDVEDGEVGRVGLEAVERRGAVGVGEDAVAFRLERDRYRGEDVAVVIPESDGGHEISWSLRAPRADSIVAAATKPAGGAEM